MFDLSLYEYEGFIGEGAFATVERWTKNGSHAIALKKFKEFHVDCIRELSALQKLGVHENIVHLLGFDHFESINHDVTMVTDLMDSTLRNMLAEHAYGVSYSGASRVYSMLRNGINYIHSQGFMHRDLKPDNILCNNCHVPEECTVKIADFGLVCRYLKERRNTLLVQTPWWRAPEVILGDSHYTYAIDMWSIGLIYMELVGISRQHIEGEGDKHQLRLIFNLVGVPNKESITRLPNWELMYNEYTQLSAGNKKHQLPNLLQRNENLKSYTEEQKMQVSSVLTTALSFDPLARYLMSHDFEDISEDELQVWTDNAQDVRGFLHTSNLDLVHIWTVLTGKGYLSLRAQVLDWVLTYCVGHRSMYTFQSTMHIFDRFIEKNPDTPYYEMPFVVLACLSISESLYSKEVWDEETYLAIHQTLPSAANKTVEDFKSMKRKVCVDLDYHLYHSSLLDCFKTLPPLLEWTINFICVYAPHMDVIQACHESVQLANRVCDSSDYPSNLRDVSQKIHESIYNVQMGFRKHWNYMGQETCESLEKVELRTSSTLDDIVDEMDVWRAERLLSQIQETDGSIQIC